MQGAIRDIIDAIRDLIWAPEPRPVPAPIHIRGAARRARPHLGKRGDSW